MAPTQSSELSRAARRELLDLARASIERALGEGPHVQAPAIFDSEELRILGASFVTLRERASLSLRGCCGSLEARFSLAEDVWRNARTSAFADPRFAPLTLQEWPYVDVHISVLSRPAPLEVASAAELLAILRPLHDGLVLEYGVHRATFLPAVWEQLPDPHEFVRHLRAKAGLSPHFWSAQIRWSRYAVQDFGDEDFEQ